MAIRYAITLLLLVLPVMAHAQEGIGARFFYPLACTGAMQLPTPRWHPRPGTSVYIHETRTSAYGAPGSGFLWGGTGQVDIGADSHTFSLGYAAMSPPAQIIFPRPRRLDAADSLFFEFWCPAGLGIWWVSVDLTYTLAP